MAKTLKANSRFRRLRSVAVWPLIAGYLALVVAFAWDPTSFAQVLAAIGIASAMAHAILYYGWKDACRPKKSFVQLAFKSYSTIKRLYVIKKVGFRYWQAETAGIAAVEKLKRTAGPASAVTWLRKAHVAKHFGAEKPSQKLRSFFARWSIKFSADYYEAKERQASGVGSANNGNL